MVRGLVDRSSRYVHRTSFMYKHDSLLILQQVILFKSIDMSMTTLEKVETNEEDTFGQTKPLLQRGRGVNDIRESDWHEICKCKKTTFHVLEEPGRK